MNIVCRVIVNNVIFFRQDTCEQHDVNVLIEILYLEQKEEEQ